MCWAGNAISGENEQPKLVKVQEQKLKFKALDSGRMFGIVVIL